MEKRFKQKGARMAIVDVESNNPAGTRFVKGLGFKQAESYIWFSKKHRRIALRKAGTGL
jgi:hypothetical protein